MADWAKRKFSDLLLEPVRNGIYKKKEFHGDGAKMVNMGELFAHSRLFDVPMKRVELNESELSRFTLQSGDLIFARRSLTAEGAGKCSIVMQAVEPTAFESSIIRARPDPDTASPVFLYYFFSSPAGRHSLGTIRRQVAVAGITGSDLSALEIQIPDIHSQRAIAATLSALDDKIELNRQMNEMLEASARALFRDWFVDFGPTKAKMAGAAPYLAPDLWALFPDRLNGKGLPNGWQNNSLAAVASLNPESWSKKTAPAHVNYVDLANTKWGYIERTESYKWDAAPSRARRKLKQGDTIVGTVRPGNGSFAFVAKDGLTGSTGFAVLRPHSDRDRSLLWCAATDSVNVDRLAHLADGGAYPAIRPDIVLASPLNLPKAPELLEKFNAVAGVLLARIERNKNENDTLAQIRDLLLPKLMSGEIRIRDAEQPVSEHA